MKYSKYIAAACLAVAALLPRAGAVPIPSNQLLGLILPGTPADAANETGMVTFLLTNLATHPAAVAFPGAGINLGDNPNDPQTEVYTLYKPNGLVNPQGPTATGTQFVTGTPSFVLNQVYGYIVAKFGQDAEAFWIGNIASGTTLDIPNLTGNGNGISGYTLINPGNPSGGGGPGVPDGGVTVTLLGIALTGLALLGRTLKRA